MSNSTTCDYIVHDHSTTEQLFKRGAYLALSLERVSVDAIGVVEVHVVGQRRAATETKGHVVGQRRATTEAQSSCGWSASCNN